MQRDVQIFGLYTLSTITEPVDASRDKKEEGNNMVHMEASKREWMYAIDL
jgi:hypothetical protein